MQEGQYCTSEGDPLFPEVDYPRGPPTSEARLLRDITTIGPRTVEPRGRGPDLASSPGPSQILSRSRVWWDQNCVTDRKWWTRLVRNVDSVCTNRVHYFRSVTYFDPRPSPDFSPRLRDKIWEWPGNEASPDPPSTHPKFVNS